MEPPTPDNRTSHAQVSDGMVRDILPNYEVLDLIGRGGMGVVYKARQLSLDRIVAIKLLPREIIRDDLDFKQRFKNEARTMAKLSHPGIVAVHDFGETGDGQLFFVMEFVDGTDLAKMIATSVRLPPDHALAITAHVCDALAYAHANGVIHRDIKPSNILFNTQGQVKITDFGLAKWHDPSQITGLTKTGVTMGTQDFMAPEALTLGGDVDHRADLYAVGVMLYQMLTGEIPRGLFLMPGVKTKGEIDPRFDRLITRAMQVEREERYQQASEIRQDLDVIHSTPRVKADASKALPAVPTKAVREVLGESEEQQKVESRKPSRVTETGEAKWSRGIVLGIVAAIVVAGVAVFRSGIRQDSEQAGGKSASVGSLATSNASDGWTDRLGEWLAVPGNASSGVLRKEGNGWRHVGPTVIGMGEKLPGKSLANVAVRLTFHHGGEKHSSLIKLRYNSKSPGSGYQAMVSPLGVMEIVRIENRELKTLAKASLPSGYDRNVSHVMEFRAEGDRLALSVDGQERLSANDASYASGSFSVEFGVIEKLEYRDLGGVVAAERASVPTEQPKGAMKAETRPTEALAASATDGWVDGLAEFFANPSLPDRLSRQRNGALVLKNGGFRISRRTDFHADLHIRVTARGGTADYWGALLTRGQGKAYAARITREGVAELHLFMPDGVDRKLLRSFTLPAGFNYAAKHTLEFRNAGDEFFVALDGQELGSARDGTLTGGTSVSLDSGPGALIEKFEYRVIPILSDTPAPKDGGGTWVDGLAEWLAVPGNASNGTLIKTDAGAWRYVGPSSLTLTAQDKPLANVAVRVTLQSMGDWLGIDLRDDSKTQRRYTMTLSAIGRSTGFMILVDGKSIPLARFGVPAGFEPRARHVVEVRAEGELLTVIVDGQTMGSIKDATFPFAGKASVVAKNCVIEKIDYRDLGGTVPTPPLPVPIGTWQDALARWWAKPETWRTGAMQQEPGGSRVLDDGELWLAFNLRNIAVRATVLGGEAREWRLGLRAKGGRCYAAILDANGKGRLIETTQPTTSSPESAVEEALATFDLPPGFSLASSHAVEFRAHGDLLTFSVDGKEVARVRDNTRQSGDVIFEGKGALIEKLEFSELGGDLK